MSGEFIIMKKYKPSNYNTKRMYGLDLLRICAMAVIFIGHSAMQIGCNYYCFAPLIYLRDITDWANIDHSVENIENYFSENGGTCRMD